MEEEMLRRAQDRDDLMRLERMELQLKGLNDDLLKIEEKAAHYNECMQTIKSDITKIKDTQDAFLPIMQGIDTVVKAGKLTKFIFGVTIVIIGAVASVLGIIDYYRKM